MKKFPRTAILVLLTLGGAWCVSQYYIKQNPLIPAPPIETIREAEELARLVATRHAAVQKSPTDTKLRWSLAQAYEQVGAVDAAARQMEIIINQNPDFLPAHLALGNTYLARRDWKKAEDLFRFVAQRSPKAPAPWGSLAAVLYQQQKYSAAIEAGRKAVNLEPESANYRYTLGVSYLESAMLYANPESQQRTLSMARYHLLEVLSQWPDNSDIYYRLGRLYSATHRWKDAVRHLNRAEELSPGDAKVVTELIKTYIASGNSAQALKETRTALRHHPNNADLQQVLGLLLQNDPSPGADQEMYMALRKAAQLNPRLPVFQDRLGNACLRLNKLSEAQAAFEKSLDLDPNRALPYQQLALIYTRMDKPKLAAQYAKAATEMTFNDRQLERFESLSTKFPTNPKLRVILADRYRALGRAEIARNEYQLALSLDPTNKAAQAGIALLDKQQQTQASPTQASPTQRVRP